MEPKVTFVVLCYKLAHFLGDCVNSILAQTFADFEVIIMDDCSPDDTPEVAKQFKDPRVIHIRNEKNLGFVPNFNKGIELSRGRYIWAISADDCLRSRSVLQRYVDLLDRNPQVGFVFCPAMSLKAGKESGVDAWSAWPGARDRILSGHEIIRRSAYNCPAAAPTVMSRSECYLRVGDFPSNLARCIDYYLWTLFATMYDVGYFAEPMVYYRQHGANMEKTAQQEDSLSFFDEKLRVLWLIKKEVEKAGVQGVSPDFRRGLVEEYRWRLVHTEVRNAQYGRTWDAATLDIRENASSESEAEEILRLLHAAWPGALATGHTWLGADYYQMRQFDRAITAFRTSLALNPWGIKPRIYIGASMLEQLLGFRLFPWLKLFQKVLVSWWAR
ncbi:MAG: glycosyltransferase [Acidobacteria bacterium]|nr:glycosyltransferase [Acidobacteriota bacterium]